MSQRFQAHSHEPTFPSRLRKLRDVDFVEADGTLAQSLGSLPASVAIVGTRRPPPGAEAFAWALARTCTEAGCVVVSGGAKGIDAAAHEGALAGGGGTFVVLGGGVDVVYPPENASLFERARAQGALVAIRPRGVLPRSQYFLERNGVIAALADHVVIVAAGFRSGARNTMDHARRLGRVTWAVPGPPWVERFAGTLLEIELGARVLTSVDVILRALGKVRVEPVVRRPESRTMPLFPARKGPPHVAATVTPPRTASTTLPSPAERAVLEALTDTPKTLDDLVDRTGLAVGSLRALLLTWTVEGVVREGPAGLFRLITS